MDIIQTIGTSTQELLAQLNIQAKVAVSEISEDDDKPTYTIEIAGEDLGVLIGYHGETLNHLQHILSLIINRKLENFSRIVVDVDGWRDQRKQSILNLVKQAIQKVRQTGQSYVMPSMSAYERRIIHASLAEESDVTSHSEGEGLSRKVIIEIKK